jgi:ABC-type protease/lipase transport system fused ATPase/permease subunit
MIAIMYAVCNSLFAIHATVLQRIASALENSINTQLNTYNRHEGIKHRVKKGALKPLLLRMFIARAGRLQC